jgi:hypothetical protein
MSPINSSSLELLLIFVSILRTSGMWGCRGYLPNLMSTIYCPVPHYFAVLTFLFYISQTSVLHAHEGYCYLRDKVGLIGCWCKYRDIAPNFDSQASQDRTV